MKISPNLSSKKDRPKAKKVKEMGMGTNRRRNICVITGTRAEYGLLRSLLHAIKARRDLKLQLIVTGTHLLRRMGYSIENIVSDGFKIDAKIRMYKSMDDKSKSLKDALPSAVDKIATFLIEKKSHIVVVLGDRLEALAGALAGLTTNTAVAHIHGGEIAPGNMDDRIRFAISAIANIHFVATKQAKRILTRIGEDPKNIFITGMIGLDEIFSLKKRLRKSMIPNIRLRFCNSISTPFITVLYHPTGYSSSEEYRHMRTILNAVKDYNGVIIGPNNDAGHSGVRKAINEFIRHRDKKRKWRYIENLAREEYIRLIYASDLLLGNSSSGILEANALNTAVVNIGPRQEGRERNGNAIFDSDYSVEGIKASIDKAVQFSASHKIRPSKAFGDGKAGERIAEILSNINIDRDLLVKRIIPL